MLFLPTLIFFLKGADGLKLGQVTLHSLGDPTTQLTRFNDNFITALRIAELGRRQTGQGKGRFRCFSCASSEYRLVLERSKAFSRSSRTPHFDNMCDEESAVQQMAPVENCQSSCITIYEPQYFGGMQLMSKPFLFIRGCADRIFESMEYRPREIDFLHQSSICLSLQLSQIYPYVQQNELVEVCSCTDNGCNFYSRPPNISTSYHIFPFLLLFFLIYFFL